MTLFENKKPKVRGRYYQLESRERVHGEWDEGNLRVLLVQPTGAGKTTTAGLIIDTELQKGGRVLVVTDRTKLTRQFAARMEDDFSIPCGVEMATQTHRGERVVCCTVQTITNRIAQGKFHPEQFSLLVFDEAHLALGAGFQSVARHFSAARILGLTATPRRGDQKDLMQFFNSLVEPVTLPQLIEQGYLAPLTIQNVPIQIALETRHKTGDYDDDEIDHAITPHLDACAEALISHGNERCSLVFLPLIRTSRMFSELLRAKGMRAEHVDGEMGEQRVSEAIRNLELGRLQALCCSQILAIGVDIRPVNLILNLRPTRSWTLFVQICGRGTRTFDPAKDNPYSRWPAKQDCLLLDPIWLTEEHSLLQRPSVLVAKDEDEAVAIDKALAMNGGGDLMVAVKSSLHEREEALRRKLEAAAMRKARKVSAMEFFAATHQPDYAEFKPLNETEAKPLTALTPKQHDWLVKCGFLMESITCYGQAKAILNSLGDRFKQGLATTKQIKYAISLGMPEDKAWNTSFNEMKAWLDGHAPKQPWQKWKK